MKEEQRTEQEGREQQQSPAEPWEKAREDSRALAPLQTPGGMEDADQEPQLQTGPWLRGKRLLLLLSCNTTDDYLLVTVLKETKPERGP